MTCRVTLWQQPAAEQQMRLKGHAGIGQHLVGTHTEHQASISKIRHLHGMSGMHMRQAMERANDLFRVGGYYVKSLVDQQVQ